MEPEKILVLQNLGVKALISTRDLLSTGLNGCCFAPFFKAVLSFGWLCTSESSVWPQRAISTKSDVMNNFSEWQKAVFPRDNVLIWMTVIRGPSLKTGTKLYSVTLPPNSAQTLTLHEGRHFSIQYRDINHVLNHVFSLLKPLLCPLNQKSSKHMGLSYQLLGLAGPGGTQWARWNLCPNAVFRVSRISELHIFECSWAAA